MSLRRSILFGVLVAIALFLGESALVLRTEVSGLSIDVEGPFAALLTVAKAALPSLITRVVCLYLTLGVFGAIAAHALSRAAELRRSAFFVIFFFVAGVLTWRRAILTPALFDDLPLLRPLLSWLVDHGEPWHPIAAVAVVSALWLLRVFSVSRRRAVAVVIIAALMATAISVVQTLAARPGDMHPLVILFGIDALRPDRLRARGQTESIVPATDTFVAEATLFSAAYTPIAQTEPAWRSLLSGLEPQDHGVRYALIRRSERKEADTFPSRFGAAGWQTVFRTDCSRFNFQDETSGFGHRLQPPRGAVNFLLEKLRYRGTVIFGGARLAGLVVPELANNRALAGFYDARAYAEALADDVVSRAGDGPLLYAFHATAAHFPGDARHPYYRRFVAKDAPLDRRLRMHFLPVIKGAPAVQDPAIGLALYDELLAQADMQLAVLLDRLREAGLYERATIVVFSDHGEDFYEDTPALAGAMSVHGAALNTREHEIVLAVKAGTKKRGPAEVIDFVRLTDVGATLLDLTGVDGKSLGTGESFASVFNGRASASLTPRRMLMETTFTHVSPDVLTADHYAGARRDFLAYRLHDDGLVEVTDETHDQIMREKDYGAFDGKNWWITWRKRDGTVASRCVGECKESGLAEWFTERMK